MSIQPIQKNEQIEDMETGEVIGQGAISTVMKGTYNNRAAVIKVPRQNGPTKEAIPGYFANEMHALAKLTTNHETREYVPVMYSPKPEEIMKYSLDELERMLDNGEIPPKIIMERIETQKTSNSNTVGIFMQDLRFYLMKEVQGASSTSGKNAYLHMILRLTHDLLNTLKDIRDVGIDVSDFKGNNVIFNLPKDLTSPQKILDTSERVPHKLIDWNLWNIANEAKTRIPLLVIDAIIKNLFLEDTIERDITPQRVESSEYPFDIYYLINALRIAYHSSFDNPAPMLKHYLDIDFYLGEINPAENLPQNMTYENLIKYIDGIMENLRMSQSDHITIANNKIGQLIEQTESIEPRHREEINKLPVQTLLEIASEISYLKYMNGRAEHADMSISKEDITKITNKFIGAGRQIIAKLLERGYISDAMRTAKTLELAGYPIFRIIGHKIEKAEHLAEIDTTTKKIYRYYDPKLTRQVTWVPDENNDNDLNNTDKYWNLLHKWGNQVKHNTIETEGDAQLLLEMLKIRNGIEDEDVELLKLLEQYYNFVPSVIGFKDMTSNKLAKNLKTLHRNPITNSPIQFSGPSLIAELIEKGTQTSMIRACELYKHTIESTKIPSRHRDILLHIVDGTITDIANRDPSTFLLDIQPLKADMQTGFPELDRAIQFLIEKKNFYNATVEQIELTIAGPLCKLLEEKDLGFATTEGLVVNPHMLRMRFYYLLRTNDELTQFAEGRFPKVNNKEKDLRYYFDGISMAMSIEAYDIVLEAIKRLNPNNNKKTTAEIKIERERERYIRKSSQAIMQYIQHKSPDQRGLLLERLIKSTIPWEIQALLATRIVPDQVFQRIARDIEAISTIYPLDSNNPVKRSYPDRVSELIKKGTQASMIEACEAYKEVIERSNIKYNKLLLYTADRAITRILNRDPSTFLLDVPLPDADMQTGFPELDRAIQLLTNPERFSTATNKQIGRITKSLYKLLGYQFDGIKVKDYLDDLFITVISANNKLTQLRSSSTDHNSAPSRDFFLELKTSTAIEAYNTMITVVERLPNSNNKERIATKIEEVKNGFIKKVEEGIVDYIYAQGKTMLASLSIPETIQMSVLNRLKTM